MTCVEPTNVISIADLGCTTGPNTIIVMQTITEAIENQYYKTVQKLSAQQIPEFQVIFNDQVSNDFNTLFKRLPPNRNYFASGVPGSFHGRLFPKKTLHFVHSASTLHWLSRVPKEITDRSSSAFNKGRIHYINAPKEVQDAYAAQYRTDFENFLHARAQELVSNGLMALQIATVPDVILESDIHPARVYELLGSTLMEMTKEGRVSEEKVDSFNVPLFYSPAKNLKEILEKNESFSVEQMETLKVEEFYEAPNASNFVSMLRAFLGDLIEQHFGGGIVDELFDRFTHKVVEFPDIMNPKKLKLVMLFVIKCNN
ncbi:probable S-adenosylmethionine-dependent methyltransferase At5g37990 [Neltuma alba]|uniref:probable S-adenosylmethionine-dependent methyltransferase At5g37990 n=1 Tax=Neltuma alba TaxID=207710 RepID=UPI0010A54C1C|nr:probable S-adenosylmethionine-dependent methyltransferase At5g37990 [Prosopis alba]